MNSRMKEAIATVRYVLTISRCSEGAQDEARNALDVIEAALDEYAERGGPVPVIVRMLDAVEQDQQANKRAHGMTLEADAYVPANPATGDRARLVAVIARPVDEVAEKRRFQRFADTLVHGDPYYSEVKLETPAATVARASTILGPYAVSCGLQRFADALRHIDPVEFDECPHCGATNGEHKTHTRYVCMGGTYSLSAAKLDEEPLSPESTAALAAGLENARQGHIQGMGSFAQYVDECTCGSESTHRHDHSWDCPRRELP